MCRYNMNKSACPEKGHAKTAICLYVFSNNLPANAVHVESDKIDLPLTIKIQQLTSTSTSRCSCVVLLILQKLYRAVFIREQIRIKPC